jgi:hypothetical protein
MSVEFIDGTFFRGVPIVDAPFVTIDTAANEILIAQQALDELAGANAENAMTSLIYLVNDLREIEHKLMATKGEPVRVTKRIGVDDQGRVVLDPPAQEIQLSPLALRVALENLLADINTGIRKETVLSRFIDLRQRRDEWTPVMNGIDGLLEVIEARLRQ